MTQSARHRTFLPRCIEVRVAHSSSAAIRPTGNSKVSTRSPDEIIHIETYLFLPSSAGNLTTKTVYLIATERRSLYTPEGDLIIGRMANKLVRTNARQSGTPSVNALVGRS